MVIYDYIQINLDILEIEEKHILAEIAIIDEYIKRDGYVYSVHAGNITEEGHTLRYNYC